MDEAHIENELWRQLLTGELPDLRKGRRFFGLLPRDPRCKICNAPFEGIGARVARMRGRGPGNKSPRVCTFCETFAEEHRGGAEVEVTLAFADVRGSTELAASMSPSEFGAVMNRFYAEATRAVAHADGFVDKLVGDEIVGFYLPAFSGPDCAARAIDAFQRLLERTGHADEEGPWIPVGAGIHTGVAYIGTVGTEGHFTDFTALGDPVNLAARLASAAGAGEILVTDATLNAGSRDDAGLERRTLQLKGIAEPVDVAVVAVSPARAGSGLTAAINTTEAAASPRPIDCRLVSRSSSRRRASTMVPAGYSDATTATRITRSPRMAMRARMLATMSRAPAVTVVVRAERARYSDRPTARVARATTEIDAERAATSGHNPLSTSVWAMKMKNPPKPRPAAIP